MTAIAGKDIMPSNSISSSRIVNSLLLQNILKYSRLIGGLLYGMLGQKIMNCYESFDYNGIAKQSSVSCYTLVGVQVHKAKT